MSAVDSVKQATLVVAHCRSTICDVNKHLIPIFVLSRICNSNRRMWASRYREDPLEPRIAKLVSGVGLSPSMKGARRSRR